MSKHDEQPADWTGKHLHLRVLFSQAGVATQIWLQHDHGALLIDAGDGVLRDLLATDCELASLEGLLITHGHFDHMGGLFSLLGFLRMIGRDNLLTIYAPAGCFEVKTTIDNFRNCYADTLPFELVLRDGEPYDEFSLAGMKIKAYPVQHCGSISGADILQPIPAVGYRISYQGETVAISGDTGDCPALRELVDGVELALIEATYTDPNQASAETLARVHLTAERAEQIGGTAKDFILIHRGWRQPETE